MAVNLAAGSGSDTLVLNVTQDAYQGSAQYTVSVDGKQVGGTFTADATRGSGQRDTLTLKGDWATGPHRAEVKFLNDAYGGSPSTDRNLHIEGATYNGAALSGARGDLWTPNPPFSLAFTDATPVRPAPVSLSAGSGSDTLVLKLSQDAYQGSAQYTVSVDGKQVGGTFTASAWRSAGQSDTLTLKGDWAAGAHTVEVRFLNDAWGGTDATDRNLYVDSATYNGGAVSGAVKTLLSAGPQSFGFTEAASATPFSPVSLTAGSGSDSLVVKLSQDAYQGSAQYTVSVDGKQVGGTFTASALKSSGQSDTLTLKGDWAAGSHRVEVKFLNDAYGGSSSADRNLHVDGATYNGGTVGGAAADLWNAGTAAFGFTDGAGAPPAPTPPSGDVKPDAPVGGLRTTFNDNFDTFAWEQGSYGAYTNNNTARTWNETADGNWKTVYHYGRTVPQNGELQYFSDGSVGVHPFRIEDGSLVITATRSADTSKTAGKPYVSGSMTTEGEFSQQYGYFEMRADLPQGKGLWPAFWMLAQDLQHPPELDIMEVVGHKSDVVTTWHSRDNGGSSDYTWKSDPDLFNGYHTFGVSWRPDKIEWYYDGEKVFTADTPSDYHKPFYLIANLAVGGNWPGSPDASTVFPAEYKIDYIRAWQYEDLM